MRSSFMRSMRAAAARASASATAAAASAPRAAPSSRLLLGAVLGGGATVLAASAWVKSASVVAEPASVSDDAKAAAAASAAKSRQRLRNVSDLGDIDFRTLGACDCPPLPDRAPRWLSDLAVDAGFQYRDLRHLLDTRGHFLFDALEGERRLSEFYYFTEKVEEPRPADGEQHPHLASSLTFPPATVKIAQPAGQDAPAADATAAAAAAAKPAAPAPAAPTAPSAPAAAAFTTMSADVPPLTAKGPEVRAVFHVGSALCGHRGIVHGGLTAALMDDVSGAATFAAAGGGHFTANLTINYMKPIRADRYLLIRAQAVKQEGRKTYVNISVEDGTGTVFARGTALYVKPRMLPTAVLLHATQ